MCVCVCVCGNVTGWDDFTFAPRERAYSIESWPRFPPRSVVESDSLLPVGRCDVKLYHNSNQELHGLCWPYYSYRKLGDESSVHAVPPFPGAMTHLLQ